MAGLFPPGGSGTFKDYVRIGESGAGREALRGAHRARGARTQPAQHQRDDSARQADRGHGAVGIGKSSLAFDTIYAEGQRRYVESLSAYARQFLGLMEKPDVDAIEGLSPAISIEQKSAGHNPRSTVGTVTEVYDYLRLLYARGGTPHCPNCGRAVQRQSPVQIAEQLLAWPEGTRIEIRAPLVQERKGEVRELFESARKQGVVRAVGDGELVELADPPKLNRRLNHSISVVVDRLVVRGEDRGRITDSIETALRLAEGLAEVVRYDGADPVTEMFSERYGCPVCGISMPEPSRATSRSTLLRRVRDVQRSGDDTQREEELIPAIRRSPFSKGWCCRGEPDGYLRKVILPGLAKLLGFDLNTPWGKLSAKVRQQLLYGMGDAPPRARKGVKKAAKGAAARTAARIAAKTGAESTWEGIVAHVQRRYDESSSDGVRLELEAFMVAAPCPSCQGQRLRPESLAVTVHGRNLGEVVELSVVDALAFFDEVPVRSAGHPGLDPGIAGPILKEVRERLRFLVDVGLDYLTLNRSAESLSGGEAQRIRLATQIGSRLVGVLYILDEPSIGLHQRDNGRLLTTLSNCAISATP